MIYVALLRAVNVSGKNMIKMPDLVEVFQSKGFNKVQTYAQSGNVVFEYENTAPRKLESSIARAIQTKMNLEVSVFVKRAEELAAIYSNNPFLADSNLDTGNMHVTFLMNSQKGKDISKVIITKEANEQFIVNDWEVYLYCPNGYGTSKLNNRTFERKLDTIATTRNWRTVGALVNLAAEK